MNDSAGVLDAQRRSKCAEQLEVCAQQGVAAFAVDVPHGELRLDPLWAKIKNKAYWMRHLVSVQLVDLLGELSGLLLHMLQR